LFLVNGTGLYAEKNGAKTDFVTLYVGQTKEIRIPVANDSQLSLEIDKVTVCCGNPSPAINMTTIPPKAKAELIQTVYKKKAGKFTIRDTVYLKDPNKPPLSFEIQGEAIQPVSVCAGWVDQEIKNVGSDSDALRLEQIYCQGKVMILRLKSDQNLYDLRKEEMINVESKYFHLKKTTLIGGGDISGSKEQNIESNRVDSTENTSITAVSQTLYLTPKSILPIGTLTDEIVIHFENDLKCYVPVEFRVVGNVYGESSSLSIGRISDSDKINRSFKIYFNNGSKVWTQVKWKSEGKLSDAINIFPSKEKSVDGEYILIFEIDGHLLASEIKGFVSAKLSLFENTPYDKNVVNLLIYGYR
jgi:hypothetical protein